METQTTGHFLASVYGFVSVYKKKAARTGHFVSTLVHRRVRLSIPVKGVRAGNSSTFGENWLQPA
jgi:hypothetical protein